MTLLTDPLEDGGSGHFWPTFLDDGRRFIYHSLGAGIFLHSVDGGEPQLLLERSFSERSSIFLVPGYLLYVENDVLWARSFDQLTLELGDDVVSIRDSVPTLGRGTAPATLSSNGLLAFWSSPVGGAMEFQWFDRNGEPLGHFGSAAVYSGFSLSPGGDRLAFSRVDSTGARDLWTLGPQGREQKITFDGDSSAPVWSPDGEGLLFTSAQELPPNLFRISSIGADPERLDEEVNVQISGNWSPDQSQIVFSQSSTTRANEIMVMDRESGEVTEGSVNSEFSETGPRLSLDGRWLAYVYDGSGQSEVWLASFPDAAMMMPIGPGSFPEWGNNELYYISDDEQMMSLEFDTSGSGPGAAVPNALFSISNYVPPFDIGLSVFQVTADGQRFLISVEAEDVVTPPINVILNWTELLEE